MAVLHADAVALVVTYLRAELSARSVTTTVHARIPNPRPPSLVRVMRTGGPALDEVRDGAQLTVEAWAPTEAEAHDLIQIVRALLNAMAGSVRSGTTVYRVSEFAGPALLPDPLSDNPRYTFTAQVSLRGAPLTP